MLRNTTTTYGLVSVVLHWGLALLIIGLFAMGYWMRTLGYYDPWYNRAPELHKSIGLLVFGLLVVRSLWRFFDRLPEPEANLKNWEKKLSLSVHRLFFVFSFVIVFSGYLIPTAEGVGIAFFGLFEVPAVVGLTEQIADAAGWLHWAVAWLMMGFVVLHTLAACKHHFVDRDRTLLKMLGRKNDRGA